MKKTDSLGDAILSIVSSVLEFCCSALAMMNLWGWYIVPLGAPALGFAHAAGIYVLVRFATYGQIDAGGNDMGPDMEACVLSLARAIFALGTLLLGWVIRFAM